MADDVLLNKAATVERCLRRIRQTVRAVPALDGLDAQDVVVLTLQRAAQACINGAMHAVRITGLGLPQSSRDAFAMLADAGALDAAAAESLQRMVGFRNVAVHAYAALNLDIVRAVASGGLGTLEDFARWMVGRA
jgi:uncharacterized protein YutE (UPF0331/DUF86 family)